MSFAWFLLNNYEYDLKNYKPLCQKLNYMASFKAFRDWDHTCIFIGTIMWKFALKYSVVWWLWCISPKYTIYANINISLRKPMQESWIWDVVRVTSGCFVVFHVPYKASFTPLMMNLYIALLSLCSYRTCLIHHINWM